MVKSASVGPSGGAPKVKRAIRGPYSSAPTPKQRKKMMEYNKAHPDKPKYWR